MGLSAPHGVSTGRPPPAALAIQTGTCPDGCLHCAAQRDADSDPGFLSIVSFAIIEAPPGDWVTYRIENLRASGIELNEAAAEQLVRM